MLDQFEQVTVSRLQIDADQHRPRSLKDLVWSSITDRGEILGLIDDAGLLDGLGTEVVYGP